MRQSILKRFFVFAALTLAPMTPSFGALTYTCDPNIEAKHAGTCAYLNGTIAPIYNNTFTNIDASIYVRYGSTELGQSQYAALLPTYSSYLAALTTASAASGNPIQIAAVKSLTAIDTAVYGNFNVAVNNALAKALNLPAGAGLTTDGTLCRTPGTGSCYDGIVTITNSSGTTLFYRNGTEPPDAYDFYGVVEHETDEVLGSSSAIDTGNNNLSNGFGATDVAPVDLFRFQPGASGGAPTLVLMSTTPGAYFSYDGGQTNGAGVYKKVYNTLANGDDYADFTSSSPCQTQLSIQDAEGCPGFDGNVDITSDGGAEINILNAIGYMTVPVITSIQNGASFQVAQALAPGTFLAVYGSNLSTDATGRTWAAADFVQGPSGLNIPTNLDGTSVTVGGVQGYVYYVSATQINIITPATLPPGNNIPVVISVKGQPSAAFTVNLASLAPAFFAYYGTGTTDDGKYLIAQHLPSYTDVGKVHLYPTAPANFTTPAKPGETIQLYGTGFGPTTPPIPAGIETPGSPTYTISATATLGGQNAPVVFAGLTPTLSQIYQVDVTIPNSATAGLASGTTVDLPLVVTVGGVKSFSGLITVQAP